MDLSCPPHSGKRKCPEGPLVVSGVPRWNVAMVGPGTEGLPDRSKAAACHRVSIGQPAGLPPVE